MPCYHKLQALLHKTTCFKETYYESTPHRVFVYILCITLYFAWVIIFFFVSSFLALKTTHEMGITLTNKKIEKRGIDKLRVDLYQQFAFKKL